MRIRYKYIIDERFDDYKRPSFFIGTCFCDFKCCKDAGVPISICQNEQAYDAPIQSDTYSNLMWRYTNNPITSAIVIGGFEPFLQFDEVVGLIGYFRDHDVHDEFVVYTGYNKHEINDKIDIMSKHKNIIIKFGRFIPSIGDSFDEVLGVTLASCNQYAERIS